MNRAIRWAFLIICGLGFSNAAEIFAYRFGSRPLESERWDELPAMKEAPVANVFITAGDELHDVTEFFRAKQVPLKDGWAIWNQTRRQLVVQAGIVDQWRVERASGFGEQTRLARITVGWLHLDSVDGTSQESTFASVTVIHGSSPNKATATARQATATGDWSIAVETETTLSESNVLDARFAIAWQGPGGGSSEQGSVSTSLTFVDGMAQPLASWFAAGHGPASLLNAKPDILLVDGSLWREARLQQVAGQAIPVFVATELGKYFNFTDFPTATGRKVKAVNLSREVFLLLLPGQAPLQETGQDPFAERPPPPPPPLPDLPEARVPADLGTDFPGPMLDLRAALKETGLLFQDDDFAVYDPFSETLFVAFGDETEMDKVQALLMTFCDLRVATIESTGWLATGVATDSLFAKATLRGRSGQIAKLTWNRSKDQPILSFEVEPAINETGAILDLRYDWIAPLPGKAPESAWHSHSMVTLADGIPLISDATKLPDGTAVKQGLKATIANLATAPN